MRRAQEKFLWAVYDLNVSPMNYDFISFLVLAEIERQSRKLEFIHVVFVQRNYKIKDKLAGIQERNDWLVRNILLQAISLIPSCRAFSVISLDQARRFLAKTKHLFPKGYTVKSPIAFHACAPIAQAAARGTSIPFVAATEKSGQFIETWMKTTAQNKKVITITLRETQKSMRNSDLASWGRFARSLDHSVYYPVFIRDTHSALDPIPAELEGLNIFREIPWHVGLRTALYEKSRLNLFVNNGPAILCILNKNARYLIFKMVTSQYKSSTEDFIENFTGLKNGDQWPWATPYQRLVWEDDGFETLRREFDRMEGKIGT